LKIRTEAGQKVIWKVDTLTLSTSCLNLQDIITVLLISKHFQMQVWGKFRKSCYQQC